MKLANDLKALVKTLPDKITSLSDQSISQSSSTTSNQHDSNHRKPLDSAVSDQAEHLTKEIASIKTTLSYYSISNQCFRRSNKTSETPPMDLNPNRRFNVVVYGIKESPPNTSRYNRSQNDL